MADTLPSIDFGFNDLRERMAQFTVRFDDFIERGRKRVLEERNAFRMSVAEMEGEIPIARTRRWVSTDLCYRNAEAQRAFYLHTLRQILHPCADPCQRSRRDR